MLAVSLLLLSIAPPPPMPANEILLPEIVHAVLWGDQVVMVHKDGGISLASMSALSVVTPIKFNSFGYPRVAYALGVGNPNVIETKYKSAIGEVTVRTNCKNYNAATCAKKHHQQVVEIQKMIPVIP